ncbi:AAA family ATPase [Sphingomonas melonis]
MTKNRILAAIKVGNFKAFADVQRLPLKPITLVYGPNSAGKSTLVQALALAHQAEFGFGPTEHPSLDIHHTVLGGSAVDLGGFRQYVHRGEAALRVRWGAELNAPALEGIDEQLREPLAQVRRLTLNLSIGIEVDDRDRPRVGAEPRVEEIDLHADDDEILRMSRRPRSEIQDGSAGRFRVDRLASEHPLFSQILLHALSAPELSDRTPADAAEILAKAVRALVTSLTVQCDSFLPHDAQISVSELVLVSSAKPQLLARLERDLPAALESLLTAVGRVVREQIGRLRYLGPLRSLPPRNVASTQQGDPDRVAGGSWAWDELRQDTAVRNAVNTWLGSDRLNTPYELKVRSLASVESMAQVVEGVLVEAQFEADEGLTGQEASSSSGPAADTFSIGAPDDPGKLAARLAAAVSDPRLERFRELVLLDKRRNAVVTHRDVGVGISQVLPVLVLCYGSFGRTIAIEQPEIHLHPGLQAELGDVFIEAALTDRSNTLVIETHSEHLLLRLQRRIREDRVEAPTGRPRITADDVAVLYVEPYERRSVVREMPLTASGELAKAWPGGFFEEGLREQLDA